MLSARAVAVPVLVVAGFALLLGIWVIGNPPFAAPEEGAHYTRALDMVTEGRLVGERIEPFDAPGLTERQLAAVRQVVRTSTVPEGLSPNGWSCHAGKPSVPVNCLDIVETDPSTDLATVFGTSQPLFYPLPGLFASLGADPGIAVDLGRLASAATALAFLSAAVAVLWDRRRGVVSLVGFLAAVTPMAVFTMATLDPSGPEIATAVAFVAGLIALTRFQESESTTWAVVAVSGAGLALSATLGPLWVALFVLLVIGWHGFRASWELVRTQPVAAAVTAAVVVVAMAANGLFELAYGPGATIGPGEPYASPGSQVATLADVVFRQTVGSFGHLEVNLPVWMYVIWWTAVLLVVAGGIWRGSTRERVTIIASVVGVIGLTALIDFFVLRDDGFLVQGQHILPFMVALPLVAGEALVRRPSRAVEELTPFLVTALVTIQIGAWFTNARRAAVGTQGPWIFLGRSFWNPPGGWLPWIALAGLAAALLLFAGIAGEPAEPALSRTRRRPAEPAESAKADESPAGDAAPVEDSAAAAQG